VLVLVLVEVEVEVLVLVLELQNNHMIQYFDSRRVGRMIDP